ncbi:MAG: dienelactone hydrolase family protein [Candidatus Dormibacteria bacterium]
MAEVRYPAPQGDVPGYLATPNAAGPFPGVVVIMDVFGMSDDLRQQCERLAGAGYLALAPDFYAWGSKIRCLRATFAALRSGTGRPFQEIEAAQAWLAQRHDCTARVGVIGFCMGGGFALLAAPRYGFAASSVNYGQVPKDADRLLRGSCPVVASYGGRDRSLKRQAARLESVLETLGIEHDVKEYPEVGHAFMNHHTGILGRSMRVFGVRYDRAASEDSWRRILSFFQEHLKSARAIVPDRDPGGSAAARS